MLPSTLGVEWIAIQGIPTGRLVGSWPGGNMYIIHLSGTSAWMASEIFRASPYIVPCSTNACSWDFLALLVSPGVRPHLVIFGQAAANSLHPLCHGFCTKPASCGVRTLSLGQPASQAGAGVLRASPQGLPHRTPCSFWALPHQPKRKEESGPRHIVSDHPHPKLC